MTIDLAAYGYRQSGQRGLWVRAGTITSFGYNDGDEYEAWVSQTVAGATDVSTTSRELSRGIRDWPSRYHLSSFRSHLVQPVLGTIVGPVLELGAGTGAVTRAVGEQGHEVLAVEGSPRRAAVCADRCRDLDNVRVVADTIQGFEGATFETVLVIGVLEYSRVYGERVAGVDPVDALLAQVARLLAPGGQLILAIENQLGLKYLAGFPEDHVGRRMHGIEDRYGDDTVVTFGRGDLRSRLERAGLTEQDWYFPFPDYKLPTAVVSERAVALGSGFDASPLLVSSVRADHQHPGAVAFELERAWPVAVRNGLVPDLANSFLVRASRSPLTAPEPIAWYFGTSDRRPEFAKVTTFEPSGDGLVVRRRRVTDSLAASVAGIEMTLVDEPYTTGTPWTGEFARLLGRDGWTIDDVDRWFAAWFGAFCADALGGAAPASDMIVAGHMLDALPRNLLVDGDTKRFIDLEWSSAAPLPLSYVVFRALFDSLASIRTVGEPAAGTPLVVRELITEVAARHGIELDPATLQEHWERERRFQSNVTGEPIAVPNETAMGVTLIVSQRLDDILADSSALPEVRAEVDLLQALAAQWQATEPALREEIERRGVALDRCTEDLVRADRTHRTLAKAVGNLEGDVRHLSRELARARAEASSTLASQTAARDSALAASQDALSAAHGELVDLRRQLGAVQATVSWRVTRPLRAARAVTRRPGVAPAATPLATDGPRAGSSQLDVDLAYYRSRYVDLRGRTDAELEDHFAAFGQVEGRRGLPAFATSRTVVREIDPGRDTVLLVLHEATRTGAPVLGWNILRELRDRHNVVVVLQTGGEIQEAIEATASATVTLDPTVAFDQLEIDLLADELRARYLPVYAVANSAATHPLAPALERAGIPVLALVHEFASSVRPHGVLSTMLETVSEVVFSAPMVAESMRREYGGLLARRHRVIPQGPSALPPGGKHEQSFARATPLGPDGVDADLPERTVTSFLADLERDTVLVIGAGTVSPRKGIEFFVQTAEQAHRASPTRRIAFAWIGHRLNHLQWYVEELWEQVVRSGAAERVTFLSPVTDLSPLYERADLFLLSSRLDPLPNVTIDAALAGVPVVAFEGASGFAEWLSEREALRPLVVPHLDVAQAGTLIAALAEDDDERRRVGDELRSAARETFSLPSYAAQLDELGRAARSTLDLAGIDVVEVVRSGQFSRELFAGSESTADVGDLVREYVMRSRLAIPRARARTGLLVRRPSEGFNPLVYAEQAPDYDDLRDGDPFADYLRKDKPPGPWVCDVLRPTDQWTLGPSASAPRILVHGHFHYTELVDEVVERLGSNETAFHLHLTTTSEEKRDQITTVMGLSRIDSWDVTVVPNRGRDLGPLITGIGGSLVHDYDLVLHVHGKRSPHVDSRSSDRWRTFLWENLIGGKYAMLDRIVAEFVAEPTLGLVFPEDPHLNDWDRNRADAERLAPRLGVVGPLATHFDFPLGNMYWARSTAIRPFIDAAFEWDEYPEEPLPIDGTMLHALERLTPFVVVGTGYSYARTAVPGVTR